MLTLASMARALGGQVSGRSVLAPGPGHSARDRSLSITLSVGSPDGFLAFSHCGDDWRACRDHVRERLGLGDLFRRPPEPHRPQRASPPQSSDPDPERRRRRALSLWREAREPDQLVRQYIAGRGLEWPDDLIGDVIRYHPACPWRSDDGEIVRVPALITALRSIHTDELVAVQRTALRPDGTKIGRRMLGLAAGAAIKLDSDDEVHAGLVVGEGFETCLAARQLGYRPAWALGSVGAISSLPALPGIDGLTILEEQGAPSSRAIRECGRRWLAAGREVRIVRPRFGTDINDAIRAEAA